MFLRILSTISQNYLSAMCVVLAIALQIQITILSNDNYAGLRINMADVFLPFLGLMILASLFLGKTKFPQFHIKSSMLWLTAISIVLVGSLINGYIKIGEWDQWALVNKTIGWFILCSYFLLGGWIAQRLKEKHIKLFLKTAVYFFIVIFISQSIFFLLYYVSILPRFQLNQFPMVGLMANKNAYTFLFISIFFLCLCFYKQVFSKLLFYLFAFCIPFLYLFTFSRSLLFISPFILALIYLFKGTANYKKIVLTLLIACTLVFSLNWVQKNTSSGMRYLDSFHSKRISAMQDVTKLTKFNFNKDITNQTHSNNIYQGDLIRLNILYTTFNLIKENPIMGSGLGSIIRSQEISSNTPVVMDNTILWLWAETGLSGLSIFLAFYILFLKTLYQNGFNKENSETAQGLNKAVFLILITFGLMSIFHELLYTRFMWFFMGLALAYPLKASGPDQN